MPTDPLVQLPERITLALDQVEDVLAALDLAAVALGGADGEGERAQVVTAAIRVVTGELWPELGHLLDEGDPTA